MPKPGIVLSLLLVLIIGFVGCGGETPTPTPTLPSTLPTATPSSTPTPVPSPTSTPTPTPTPTPTLTPSPTTTPMPTPTTTPIPTPTPTPSSTPTPVPSELPSIEIREYEGEELSSIDEFRENSINGPQYIDMGSYELHIIGLVENEISYKYDEVIETHESYKKVVTLLCVEGWSVKILWEGMLVRDLIEEAKALPEAKVVIFHAYDGYTTSLPLDYIVNKDIIMAYKINGLIIPPERGFPFELVAESKFGYKWIKWITQIELSDDVSYRGSWESVGFPNEGDLPNSLSE